MKPASCFAPDGVDCWSDEVGGMPLLTLDIAVMTVARPGPQN